MVAVQVLFYKGDYVADPAFPYSLVIQASRGGPFFTQAMLTEEQGRSLLKDLKDQFEFEGRYMEHGDLGISAPDPALDIPF